jgi:hypothetical protein
LKQLTGRLTNKLINSFPLLAWQYENTKVKHHGANGRLTNNYRPLKNPLSSALVEVLKPVFEKLSSLQLLQGLQMNDLTCHLLFLYIYS